MHNPYQSAYTGEEVDSLLSGSIQCSQMTQIEYDQLSNDGNIDQHRWYLIYRDSSNIFLERVYIGRTLFALRGDKASAGFPYIFPIIFV